MKWILYFLCLFFVPNLIDASYDSREYKKDTDKILAEWKQHGKLIEQFQSLTLSEQEQNFNLLHTAIACCQQAIGHCDRILKKIGEKSKKERKHWEEAKNQAKKNKTTCNAEIGTLRALIEHTHKEIIFSQAIALYHQSEKKAHLASTKNQSCARHLNNVEEVVSTLNEVYMLYEEALLLARDSLSLISSYPEEASKHILKTAIDDYQVAANQYKTEAINWLAAIEKQQDIIKEQVITFKTTSAYFLTKEKRRRELFFKSESALNPEVFLHSILQTYSYPCVFSLDGGVAKKNQIFTLYAEQFYRFLIQSEVPIQELVVTVYKKGESIYEEVIKLPLQNTPSWERYLDTEGMLCIPKTKLSSNFGLDLRLSFFCDPRCNFSMIIAQNSNTSDYQFSFSLTDKSTLYVCHFAQSPPWQLECLRKPAHEDIVRPIDKHTLSLIPLYNHAQGKHLENSFPVLDQFVDQIGKDPLALAAYVYNEIELDHRLPYQEKEIFQALGIQRNACMTFLAKRGSPWEQCQLLVYLLRKAGYHALYVTGTICALPKIFLENMLLTKLPSGQVEGLVNYPWVTAFDGKEWVSLFPWMKEMQVHEGHDLYHLMPEEYASAARWILSYLKEDKKIVKHIGSDRDDTLGVLFTRFVEEELRQQGLSLADVGIHSTPIKKQFPSWASFPRPKIANGTPEFLSCLDKNSMLFAKANIEIFSHENPKKKISKTFPLVDLNSNSIPLGFTKSNYNQQHLHAHFINQQEQCVLSLDQSDQTIDIKVEYENFIGLQSIYSNRTISMNKGDEAALCFHLGGTSPSLTSQFYEQFSSEQDDAKRLYALLAFVGAAYFEKCGRAEKTLAQLHKTAPIVDFAFGLIKLSNTNTVEGTEELKTPQIDMMWCFSPLPPSISTYWQRDVYSVLGALESLITVDSSSNEHQILLDIFGVKQALSTVKLLQLTNREQQKNGLEEPGFLRFTASQMAIAEESAKTAHSPDFSYLQDSDLCHIKATSCGLWDVTKQMLNQGNAFDTYAYAYMTPMLPSRQDTSYNRMGALIFHPLMQAGLISSNHLLLHGGIGTPLPHYYFDPMAINHWELIPSHCKNTFGYILYVPPPSNVTTSYLNFFSSPSFLSTEEKTSFPETIQWSTDVRLEHRSFLSRVGDPVDIITGAFYIDEIDLALPGPFPLEIRRNYNSQNPLVGDLGIGWKLSLNPTLVKQDGKLYASEADGTVIAYRYNHDTSRWEIFPEDNPDLFHFYQSSSPTANPFHAYIEDDILYGADGSKRIFKDNLLRKWINNRGNTLEFFYSNSKLSRIESSNHDFCGLLYNHEGKISEIYSKDGRRIYYHYNPLGDLVEVTLPNAAIITYEYDHSHRIIRESKPHGKILENIYKGGKVQAQRSPTGHGQSMATTVAFDYHETCTTVTDANEGKTTYKIFQNQIYKIIDPLGYETMQAWFINEESWFDPALEQIIKGKEVGGAARCLKSSTDKRGLTISYHYDCRGNPTEIRFQGADLTGSSEPLITKKFLYNNRDLCIEEEILDKKTITTYDLIYPYLPKRIETYSGNILISYLYLDYNDLGQIEKENDSGSILLWKYDPNGLPCQKIQLTGTDDPDVITTYAYNTQGQCIKIESIDRIQENNYDIMGNQIESKTFSHSGTLLSAIYTTYDLNHQPILKQTANPNHTLYIDYHSSGLIKATRQSLSPAKAIAYTLYEHDLCGNLIEEVDPLGYTTYRDYDALGRIKSETKEGHSTHFTYESGGLLETITTPSNATITRLYTTNGLLKEEIYPDGSKTSLIYDAWGRPIQETSHGISWAIIYDDPHHRMVRTNISSKLLEIHEFNSQGNLIRFTDAAGYTSEKTYDGLGRIKTETSPSGEQTIWNYQGDTVICTLPNGEKKTQRYEGSHIAHIEVINAQGHLLANTSYHYDPQTGMQAVVQGTASTMTWTNAHGLPIKVQKGDIITTYEYDFCDNCIAINDGDGRETFQTFDGLRRITQKKLPDGSLVGYVYDLDSNLTEYHLPNGSIWKASYDSMKRKTKEALHAGSHSSLCWEYNYENGYLKATIDPMQRMHVYLYDLNGRLIQETVDDWQRNFSYDPRGLLTLAEQIKTQNITQLSSGFYSPSQERSIVERAFDADGRLILENIYLNSILIQQTNQNWDTSGRTLQIDDHRREFIYQNRQLTHILTQGMDLAYVYNLHGSLMSKSTPFSTTLIDYNPSGLPENIRTQLSDHIQQETLNWLPSGKLAAYSSSNKQQQFTYTERGYLKNAGKERYDFDFGTTGTGIRTTAPLWMVPKNGIDVFGKITTEFWAESPLTTIYNSKGEVILQNSRQFEWDPWGRLLRVSDQTFTWTASYDALGRRLQTHYRPCDNAPFTTTSFYDPETEFQEIGVKYADNTFWKIYGPNSCDAVTDNTGASVILIHNALNQLARIVSQQETIEIQQYSSPYGPQGPIAIPSDLISYAQLLTWHSQAQDPTSFVWMGKRYYDPQGGRFLSPDPIGYPACLDLYAYAKGDPINYLDPDGRFASPVYQTIKPMLMGAFQPLVHCFNAFPAYLANHSMTRSESFQVGSFDLPRGAIGFINGINNTAAESRASAKQLSQYAGGAKIYGIYNATNWDSNRVVSTAIDILECTLGHLGIHTPPIQLLKNKWAHFIANHGSEEKILEHCHSGGAIDIKNALLDSPPSVRQRIIVLAIAPAVIIPKDLCFTSYNYISKRDVVTHLDIIGKIRHGNELQILEPHPDANLWDHEFLSPTFKDPIERHIADYIKHYGGRK